MYVKIKVKKLHKLEKARKAVEKISEIVTAPAETDKHGNSSYKSDRPLREIIDALYFAGFIPSRNFIPEKPQEEKEIQVVCR